MPEQILTKKQFLEMEKKKAPKIKEPKRVSKKEPKAKTKKPKAESRKAPKKTAKKKSKKEIPMIDEAKAQTEVPIEDIIEMQCYIKYNLFYGQPKKEIVAALASQGWSNEEIKEAFREVKKLKAFLPARHAGMPVRKAIPSRQPMMPPPPQAPAAPVSEENQAAQMLMPPQAEKSNVMQSLIPKVKAAFIKPKAEEPAANPTPAQETKPQKEEEDIPVPPPPK